ncbi:MAG: hypothetical protein GX947_02055 [Tissierellia bacterium]|nr:hypothetical protein [Tissierellia bacterium]
MKIKKFKSKGIAALVTVVSLGSLVFIISLSTATLTFWGIQNLDANQKNLKAYYAAFSGIQDSLIKLERNKDFSKEYYLSINDVDDVRVVVLNTGNSTTIYSEAVIGQVHKGIEAIVDIEITGLIVPIKIKEVALATYSGPTTTTTITTTTTTTATTTISSSTTITTITTTTTTTVTTTTTTTKPTTTTTKATTTTTKKKANGSTCSSGSECVSGYCYVDNDGDRYAPSSGTKKCQASSQLSGTDCCDSDSRAKPGQTSYYTTTNNCGSWDYDCNGSTTKSTNCDKYSAEEGNARRCYALASCSSGSETWRGSCSLTLLAAKANCGESFSTDSCTSKSPCYYESGDDCKSGTAYKKATVSKTCSCK